MTIHQLLEFAQKQLSSLTETPRLEVELLLAHTLNKSRTYLIAHRDEMISEQTAEQFAHLLQRRLNQEPIAYIIGKREFWSIDLDVTNDTLIPRPETELLIEKVNELVGSVEQFEVADLGTGSGAIALALAIEHPSWHIDATDVSKKALLIARKNAHKLGIQNISFFNGSWCDALPIKRYDLIVSNPPYISEIEWEKYADGLRHEPRQALLSGKDGLDAIRMIASSAKQYLKPKSYLFIEHGENQGDFVHQILLEENYQHIVLYKDFSNKPRLTRCETRE